MNGIRVDKPGLEDITRERRSGKDGHELSESLSAGADLKHIVIIGAGIIGLSCAYALRKRGASVVIIDRGTIGRACSFRNAGWITPSLSAPIASPGLTLKSLRWLLRRTSPLYIKPTALPRLAGWLWQFRRYCNHHDYEAGFRAVATLNNQTMSLYDDLEQDGVRFEMNRSGILYVFGSDTERQHVIRGLDILEECGFRRPSLVDRAQLGTLEPALQGGLTGGLLFEDERYVEPHSLCLGLGTVLQEEGVEILENTEMHSGMTNDGRVTGVMTDLGQLDADAFLIAAGAWTGEVAARFGFYLPVQAGKGYSITIDRPDTRLVRPILLADPKIGLTPFRTSVRIAGTMELSGINLAYDQRRIDALARAVTPYLPDLLNGERRVDWVGMRPLTPDGLPIISRLPSHANVYVATGHAMLGFTLALSTAHALATLIVNGESEIDLGPFDAGRFAKTRALTGRRSKPIG